jgi:5-methylcytosine-specific restriction enzyme B
MHPSNPSSGPYGGMSMAKKGVGRFEPPRSCPLIGTKTPDPFFGPLPASFPSRSEPKGLSPDEEILGRPGHARKVQGICSWFNRKYGSGKLVAWAKEDPVRSDQELPANLVNRYGKVLYAILIPTEDAAATPGAA